MKKRYFCIVCISLFFGVAFCLAQASQPAKAGKAPSSATKKHVMVSPDDLKWGPLSQSFVQGTPGPEFAGPPKAQVAVVSGDPTKPGPYVIRIKTPDGEKIPPHWHPQDENVTVLQGTLAVGTGDKFDQTAGHDLPAGGYLLMPKGVHHFAWSKGESLIQVHGQGPFKIIFVGSGAKAKAKPASAKSK
ncbi:MAG TPA: cupin domain-containing protein [Acidobacteriota bacterium]|jgi:quercetin dioxygenase-like cupin family protein